jgi:hypothetical protein
MRKITSEVIFRTFFGTSGKDKLINNVQLSLEILNTFSDSIKLNK